MSSRFQIKSTSKAVNNESIINNNNNISNNEINITNNNINDSSKFAFDRGTEMQKRNQKSSMKSKPLIESRNKEEQSRFDNNFINTNNNININNLPNAYDIPEGNRNTKNYVLGFSESQSNSPFKIKICSNYIDPSSGMLSFSSPVWLVCQSIEKHLTIKPNYANDNFYISRKRDYYLGFNLDKETEDERKYESSINITNKRKTESFKMKSKKYGRNKDKNKKKAQNNYIISFDSIDTDNSLNNIYG